MARYTNPGAISSAGGASCIVCSLITVVYACALHLHFIRRTRTRVRKQAGIVVRLELRGFLNSDCNYQAVSVNGETSMIRDIL